MSITFHPVQNSFGPVEGQGINFSIGFEAFLENLNFIEKEQNFKKKSILLCTVLGYASFAEVDFDRRHDDVIYD